MIGKVMRLSVFYCLCYDIDISTYMSEDQVLEEIDTDLNEEEDIIMDEIMDEHWRDVAGEGDDKKKIHALRWDICVEEKGGLMKREFLVSVPHLKVGNIVWNFVKEHIIDEKEQYKYIGLRGFDYK